jgi:hypothetical protein
MAEIVNLRMARKARQRTNKERAADEARARHGQGKAEREIARIDAERAERMLAGLRRDATDTEAD